MQHGKRRLAAVLTVLVIVGGAGQGLAGMTLFGGATKFMYSDAEYWKLGFHGGARLTVPLLTFLEVGGQFTVNRNKFDWEELHADFPGSLDPDDAPDMHVTIVELLGIAKLNAPGGKLYAQGGIGFARVGGGNVPDEDNFEDYNRFVAALGGGVDLGQLEIIAMYHFLSWGSDVELDWERYQDYFDYASVSIGIGF